MAEKRKSQEDKAAKAKPSLLETSEAGVALPIEGCREAEDLSNEKLRKLAAKHQPPQSWYEEDMEGLY